MPTVLQHILEWSQSDRVPLWQQDALRRLLQQSELTPDDITELVALCRASHELEPIEGQIVPDPDPLSEALCNQPDGGGQSIQLLKLHGVKGVNALAEDQEINFGRNGVTVIYGDNGSGKSGYGRLLRTLCGARGNKDHTIHSNVYTQDHAPIECQATMSINGEDVDIAWQQNDPPPPQMSSIGIFDSDAAYCYAAQENDAAFVPFGLDLFNRLASVCGVVADKLQSELNQLEAVPDYQELEGDHAVGEFIGSLDENTPIELLNELAVFSEEDEKALTKAQEDTVALKANSPPKQAADKRNQAGRFETAARAIGVLEDGLSEAKTNQLKQAIQAQNVAAQAAAAAAQSFSSDDMLPDTGGEAWKVLWEAARRYSQEGAYPDQAYPETGDDARCVLCQQKLDAPSKERLKGFEEYIKDDIQKQAEEADRLATKKIKAVADLNTDEAIAETTINELKQVEAAFEGLVQNFVQSAAARKTATLALADDLDTAIPPLSPSPREKIEALVASLRQEAEALDGADADEELAKLDDRIAELTARKKLTERRADVAADIERRGRAVKVRKCLDDTRTRPISTKSGELTEQFVTRELCDHFAAELNKLDRYGFQIALKKSRASRGRVFHQVELQCEGDAPIQEVLSEGELRCVALAGFLTELWAAPGKPPLIFDDPVSSLDHRWRRKVAERLVQESARRQVIVFTHDLVFMLLIEEIASAQNSPHEAKHLRRGGPRVAGIIEDGAPWSGMKFKARKGVLENLYVAAKKVYDTEGEPAYEPHAKHIYGKLREAWERAIEEVLLNGAIQRFSREVHTKPIAKLTDITQDDYTTIEEGMGRCSTFFYGHDDAAEINEPTPTPDDLRKDLDLLIDWVKGIRDRRK